ncbi:NAD(P)-binding protein [Hypoxylon cercidicola]|nr:NAD(P)-binding protein [Hypoxylon cercidicola]
MSLIKAGRSSSSPEVHREIAARSEAKIHEAIGEIKQRCPSSRGKLEALIIDLANLDPVKPAVENFISKEQRLDVLFNNAGVMGTNPDEKSAQGYELQMGTNVLGPYLFTRLLEPILLNTAIRQSSPGDVRIVWVGSMLNVGTPKGGVVWDSHTDGPSMPSTTMANYMQSKAGITFLGHEFAKKLGEKGIISTSLHPGMMKTKLQWNMPAPVSAMMSVVFKGPTYGAFTELYAGFSSEIQSEQNGRYIIPWGRLGSIPQHMAPGILTEEQGGTGLSKKFWDWCEATTVSYH